MENNPKSAPASNMQSQPKRKTSIAQDANPMLQSQPSQQQKDNSNVNFSYREQSPSTTSTSTMETTSSCSLPSKSTSSSPITTTTKSACKTVIFRNEKISTTTPDMTDNNNPFFYLKWNDFDKQLTSGFSNLFNTQEFADVTLSCEGKSSRAHKIVLAMCSTYFRTVLLENPCKHPVVIIKGIKYQDLQNILKFIYFGQVSVVKSEIPDFITAAEFMGLDGISTSDSKSRTSSKFSSTTPQHTPFHSSTESISQSSVKQYQQRQRNMSLSEEETRNTPSVIMPVTIGSNTSANKNNRSANSPHNTYDNRHVSSQESPYSPGNISNPPSVGSSVSSSCSLSQDLSQQQQASPSNLTAHHVRKKKYGQWAAEDSNSTVTSGTGVVSGLSGQRHSQSSASVPSPNYNNSSNFSSSSGGGSGIFRHEKHRSQEHQQSSPTVISADPCGQQSHQPDAASKMSLDSARSSPGEYELSILPAAHSNSPASSSPSYSHLKNKPFNTRSGMVVHQWSKGRPSTSDNWTSGQIVTPVITNIMGAAPLLLSSPSSASSSSVLQAINNRSRSNSMSFRQTIPHSPAVTREANLLQFQNGPHATQNLIPKLSLMDHPHIPRHVVSSLCSSSASTNIAQQQSSYNNLNVSVPAKKRFSHLNNCNKYPPYPPDMVTLNNSDSHLENSPMGRHNQFPLLLRNEIVNKSASSSVNTSSLPSLTSSSMPTPSLCGITPMALTTSTLNSNPNLIAPVQKYKNQRHSQVPQSARYTTAEVDKMVDSVSHLGPFVPCSICDKLVKRERLRAHIHECHLVSGEKIICPFCGVGLKSKGSYRVHVWRHRRGVLAKGMKNKKNLALGRSRKSANSQPLAGTDCLD